MYNRSMGDKETTVSIIYDLLRDALLEQQKQRNSLEAKSNMLTAFAGGMFALLISARVTLLSLPIIGQLLVGLSIFLFSVSVILALVATWVRKYRIDPNPEILANNYLNVRPSKLKLQLVSNMVGAWKENAKIIEQNANKLRFAFLLQTFAFLSLGIAVFLSIF